MYTYGFLFFIPFSLLYTLLIVIHGICKKRAPSYYFYAFLLGIYLNFLIKYAFFPIYLPGDECHAALSNYVSLDPFSFFSYSAYQIAGNILLTFPLGILSAFIINADPPARTFHTILGTASIELIQLFLIMTLHPVNVIFDLSDIILNIAGGLLGNILFYLFCRLYMRIPHNVPENPFLQYFDLICTNCAHHKKSFARE